LAVEAVAVGTLGVVAAPLAIVGAVAGAIYKMFW